jgi:hypothetical protein
MTVGPKDTVKVAYAERNRSGKHRAAQHAVPSFPNLLLDIQDWFMLRAQRLLSFRKNEFF